MLARTCGATLWMREHPSSASVSHRFLSACGAVHCRKERKKRLRAARLTRALSSLTTSSLDSEASSSAGTYQAADRPNTYSRYAESAVSNYNMVHQCAHVHGVVLLSRHATSHAGNAVCRWSCVGLAMPFQSLHQRIE
jgi:hypothetical protein